MSGIRNVSWEPQSLGELNNWSDSPLSSVSNVKTSNEVLSDPLSESSNINDSKNIGNNQNNEHLNSPLKVKTVLSDINSDSMNAEPLLSATVSPETAGLSPSKNQSLTPKSKISNESSHIKNDQRLEIEDDITNDNTTINRPSSLLFAGDMSNGDCDDSDDMNDKILNSPSRSIKSATLPENIPKEASPFDVKVIRPQKQGEGNHAYVTYLIEVSTALDQYNNQNLSVRRRFQDFSWLQKRLMEEHPACLQPPLPGKHRLEYFTGDRFSPDFLEKRRLQLEIYLQRVARHPQLQRSHVLQKFLETEGAIISDVQEKNFDTKLIENISEAFLHALDRVKSPDERFIVPRETVSKLENNLTTVVKLHTKLLKQFNDIQGNFGELSSVMIILSSLENDYLPQLSEYGSVLISSFHLQRERSISEDFDYVSNLREYISYCEAVKNLIKIKEQKQIDMEQLQNYLSSTINDQERTLSGRGSPGIAGFIKDKYNDLTSSNHEEMRKEKLNKLTSKIAILKNELESSTKESSVFSDIVLSEVNEFNKLKVSDFKGFLDDYTATQLEFHESNYKLWDNVVKSIDNNTFGNEGKLNPEPNLANISIASMVEQTF